MSHDQRQTKPEMRFQHRWLRRALASFLALTVVAGLWWIMPPQMGGKTTLLTTKGVSMAPSLATGDLAIIRQQSNYQVGDVVAYYSENLQAMVLHRVIDLRPDGSLTTQGDNNTWVDLDHPLPEEVTGKMVHSFAGGGNKLDFFGSPLFRIFFSLFVAYAVYFSIRSLSIKRTQVSPAQRPPPKTRQSPVQSRFEQWPTDLTQYTIYGLTALLIMSSVSAFVAFSRPVIQTNDGMAIYNLKGEFEYTADVGPSGKLVYPEGQAVTGDSLFFNLVDQLHVTYKYTFDTPTAFDGNGSLALDAIISGESGWTHVIPLTPAEPFAGNSAEARAVIDLDQVQTRATEIQQLIGIRENGYSLAVQASVNTAGTFAGENIEEKFVSDISFNADSAQLRPLAKPAPGEDLGPRAQEEDAVPASEPGDAVVTGKGGSVQLSNGIPGQLSALGASVNIAPLRIISVVGIVVSLIGLALIGVLSRRRSGAAGSNEHSLSSLFIPVTGWAVPVTSTDLYDVASINDLVALARRNGRLILHETQSDAEVFILNIDDVSYRYVHYPDDATARFGASRESEDDSNDNSSDEAADSDTSVATENTSLAPLGDSDGDGDRT